MLELALVLALELAPVPALVPVLAPALAPALVLVLVAVPSSHYYLGSLSWTSRTLYFLDSRDPLEVLGGLAWQMAKGSLGDPPGP